MGNYLASLLDQFGRELEVTYRGELYRVRDNGAVCRKLRPAGRKRPLDNQWTFGVANASTGYMQIGAEVVHRIVATAFHGTQPSEKHIVDHADTNRQNNRAENLRWVTRLDNILNNAVTRRRIEIAYGSLDAFFDDPRAPLNPDRLTNFEWMRTVTKEEAQESRERFERWATSTSIPSGSTIGEWVFGARYSAKRPEESVSDVASITPNAVQRNWKTPAMFEQCPDECSLDALAEYASRLAEDTVFASNTFGQSVTVVARKGENFLSVVCHVSSNPIREWAVAKVTIENDKFVHESFGSFFTFEGAMNTHCRLLDIPCEYGETIDDFA